MQRHDGSRLPVRVRIAPIHSRRGRIAGALQVFQPAAAGGSAQRLDQLERAALMDDLTGIANRRLARQTLQKRLEELRRYGWPFGVLLLDIDHFKQVNDSRGHDAGDEVLKVVARTLEQSVRPFDLVSRWGGEEFVVIAANLEASQLRAMADRLRLLIETSMTIIRGLPLRVTVSVGATMAQPDDTSRDVVARADALMYRSKRAGRNCVTAAAEAA
jgi:diguanylate cyclase (GGDEF)-like protein